MTEWPRIIFGTSALGNLYAALSDEVKLEIVAEAVRHSPVPVIFDSAGKYGAGLALEKLGECLGRLDVSPEKVVISNKLGWKRVPLTTPEPTFEQGVWMDIEHDAVQDISYRGILECYEQGNALLGGTYLPQLVSVHDPDEYLAGAADAADRQSRLTDIAEAYRALHELKAAGKVAAVGVGSKDWKVIQEIDALTRLDWVMFANSMTILQHPQQLLDFMADLHQKGVKIINSAVFHAGFLIGGAYFDYELIKPDTNEHKALFEWRTRFTDLCTHYRLSPSVACIQFGRSAPGVASISLNTSKPQNVKQNVDAVYAEVPSGFWKEMKQQGLIREDYPYL